MCLTASPCRNKSLICAWLPSPPSLDSIAGLIWSFFPGGRRSTLQGTHWESWLFPWGSITKSFSACNEFLCNITYIEYSCITQEKGSIFNLWTVLPQIITKLKRWCKGYLQDPPCKMLKCNTACSKDKTKTCHNHGGRRWTFQMDSPKSAFALPKVCVSLPVQGHFQMVPKLSHKEGSRN